MDSPTVAGIVGAVALALVGWIGKSAATVLRDRAKRREIETAGDAESMKRREERPWALMESRIEDLEEALGRLSNSNDKLRTENDRLREERDKTRIDATDWQIKARMADALKDQCEQERLQHAEEVRGLREQIAKLRRGNE